MVDGQLVAGVEAAHAPFRKPLSLQLTPPACRVQATQGLQEQHRLYTLNPLNPLPAMFPGNTATFCGLWL